MGYTGGLKQKQIKTIFFFNWNTSFKKNMNHIKIKNKGVKYAR